MNFNEALNAVRHGKTVTRKSWEKEHYYLSLYSDELCICEKDGAIAAKIKNTEYYTDSDDWYILGNMPKSLSGDRNREKAKEIAREAIEAMDAAERRKEI